MAQMANNTTDSERRPTSDDSYEEILHYARSHGERFSELVEAAKKECDVASKERCRQIRQDIIDVIDGMPASCLYRVPDNAKTLSKLGVVLSDKQLARIESELTTERLRLDNVGHMAKLLLIGESKRDMVKVAEQWLRRSLSENSDYFIVVSNSKSIYEKLGVPVKTIFAIIDDESIVPEDRARQVGMYFLDSFFMDKKSQFSRELANDMIDILIIMKKATYLLTGPTQAYDEHKGWQVLQTTEAVRKYDVIVRDSLEGRVQDADAFWILRKLPSDVVIERRNELREAGFMVDVKWAVAQMLEDQPSCGLALVKRLFSDGVMAWDAGRQDLVFS